MTPKSRWSRIAPVVLSSMTASCAALPLPSADPPRLILPQMATMPCVLDRLPEAPTQADLEVAYIERGARLIECEMARALAVETLTTERALQDRWRRDSGTRAQSAFRLW